MTKQPVLAKRPSSNDRGVSPPPTKRRQQSATTNKAVTNFFTPLSKKEPENMSWRVVKDSLLVGRYGASSAAASSKRRIAAFDLDSTLIIPASGKKFAKDAADWKWWHSSVPSTLKKLHGEGYIVAVFSNQGGISLKPDPKTIKSDQKRLADFKGKVSTILTQLDLPISIYAATGKDEYRKPRVGMWQEILDDYDCNGADTVDLENSFFVGDAGGRAAVLGGAVKDHSCVDRDFAANVGLPFHTPEEYFLREEPRPFVRMFEPTQYMDDVTRESTSTKVAQFTKNNTLDIVLLCGSPGAGKSSFYWKHLQPHGYARVNQDILKTREKCIKVATALVKEEATSVVIDNTNADPNTREIWVQVAQKLSVPIRCILFTAPAKLCEHNDAARALNPGPQMNPESRAMLPKLAFTGFASRYREPKVDEGFQDIVSIDFEVEGDAEFKKLWARYWA